MDEVVLDDMDPAGPGPLPTAAELRIRGITVDTWVEDTFKDVYRQLESLTAIKRDKKQPKVWLQMPSEVLKAFELGVVTKAEARDILGLKKVRQPAALARARAARAGTTAKAKPPVRRRSS